MQPNAELSEEFEVKLASLLAQAGQQLTQENQAKAAQAAAQQKMQDPIIQMQQAELQLKQAEQQRKARKIRQMLRSTQLAYSWTHRKQNAPLASRPHA
jgi:hypothetical protein